MNKIESFNQFLASQQAQIALPSFLFNLSLAVIFAFILSRIYIYCGYSLSNRRVFAKNFILLTMTTMLIITIVKSSLALSLGLVGALSIVRFRSAIKEPEELAYLFLCIAIGLGLGANQAVITSTAFVFISVVLAIKKYFRDAQEEQNLFITIDNIKDKEVNINEVVEILKSNSLLLKLVRLNDNEGIVSASFNVQYKDFVQLEVSKNEIKKLSEKVQISFIDNKGSL